MNTVAEIQEAIEKLSLEERAELMASLRGEDEDDDWDRQMKADAAAGKFDALNREALAEHQRGETRALEDLL